ncbi:hypothetical protein evm_015398, partial [Chilo suppressalis]
VQIAAPEATIFGFKPAFYFKCCNLLFSDWNQSSASCAVKPEQSVQDPSNLDTPRKHNLRKRVLFLETKLKKDKKRIKTLNQKVRRLIKRNKSLKEILQNLKKQDYINTDLFNELKGNIAVVDIFLNIKLNIKQKKVKKKSYTLPP